MTRGTLKIVRFWAPPLIIFIFAAAAAQALGFGEVSVPKTAEDLAFNGPIIVMAVGYYLSPLRSWANSGYHEKVVSNIRTQILTIANIQDPEQVSQSVVMNVFWRQIDADESLKNRSEDIMFNGAIWTTLADIVSLSIIFSTCFTLTWFFGFINSFFIAIGFAIVAVCAALFQILATAKHIKMSNKQLEYIAQYRRAEVAADLASALNA